MLIYGKEYGFRFTVGASIKIAKLCPEGKLENLEAILNAPTAEALESIAKMAVIMNEGYRMQKAFSADVTVPDFDAAGPALTEELILSLDANQMEELTKSLLSVQKNDSKTTVGVAPAKKKAVKAPPKSG